MANEKIEVREKAQQAWQTVCLNAGVPGKEKDRQEVNRLMADQLANKDIPLETACWLLQQIQWTGDASVVSAIAPLLKSEEVRICDRAARALAKIPDQTAEDALKAVDGQLSEAQNQVVSEALADRKVHLANAAAENEPPMSLPYIDDATFEQWLIKYLTLSEQDKVRTLAAVKVRKAKKAVSLVVEALKSENEQIHDNALFALETIGGVDEIPLMLELLYGKDREKVEWIMPNIVAEGFDDALIAEMVKTTDNGRFEILANILANRGIRKAAKPIMERVFAESTDNRFALLVAVEQISSKDNIGEIVDAALMIPTGRNRDQVEQIIARLCQGDYEPVAAKINDKNRSVLLPMIGRIGGEKTLEYVTKQLGTKNHVPAVRALCNWPNAVVADKLWDIAQNDKAESNRIAAIRALIRVITLRPEDIGISITPEEQIAKLREAVKLSGRIEEKKLALSRTESIRHPVSLEFVVEYLDNADLKEEACRAALDLTHHYDLRHNHKEQFEPVLKRIAEITTVDLSRDQARWYLEHL